MVPGSVRFHGEASPDILMCEPEIARCRIAQCPRRPAQVYHQQTHLLAVKLDAAELKLLKLEGWSIDLSM